MWEQQIQVIKILIYQGPCSCWVSALLNRSFATEKQTVSDDELVLQTKKAEQEVLMTKAVFGENGLLAVHVKYKMKHSSALRLHKSFLK